MRIRMKLFHQRNHSQFNTSQSGAVGDFIMAGITTSETLAGEQPKDDDQRLGLTQTMNRVGGRLAELTVEMRQTKSKSEELNRTFLALTADVEELQKEYTDLSESLHQLDHGR